MLLGSFVLAHLALSWLLFTPGHLSIDEGIYHLAARDTAAGRFPFVENGWTTTRAPELALPFTVPSDRGLAPIYPPGQALLAAPLYRELGFGALFLLNNLAFLATLALVASLARAVTGDPDLALPSVLVFALATYGWQYSQAAWPHALSVLAIVGATRVIVTSDEAGISPARALLGGVLAGLGVWIRVDVAFALPGLAAVAWMRQPRPRWRAVVPWAIGASLPLGGLAAVNAVKFGEPTPFTYGVALATRDPRYFLPLAAGVAGVAAVWAARRHLPVGGLWRWAAAVALFAGLVAWTPSRQALVRLGAGAWHLFVDTTAPETLAPGMRRSALGGVLYMGHLKTSLLQSCPYLALLLAPALRTTDPTTRRTLGALACVPVSLALPLAFLGTDGGLCLNQRYLLPMLPFAAILIAWCLRESGATSGRTVVAATLGIATAALAGRWPGGVGSDLAIRCLPLLLALAIALSTGLERHPAAPSSRPIGRRTRLLASVGLGWAFGLAFLYHAPATRHLRQQNLETGRATLPVATPGATVLGPYLDPFFGLADVEGIRFSRLSRPDGDWSAFAIDVARRGRPVLLAVPAAEPSVWTEPLERRGVDLAPAAAPAGFRVYRVAAEDLGDPP